MGDDDVNFRANMNEWRESQGLMKDAKAFDV